MSALQDPETEYDDLGVIIDSLMEENDHLRTHLERILNVLAEQTAKTKPDDQPVGGTAALASEQQDRRDHSSWPFETNETARPSVQLNESESEAPSQSPNASNDEAPATQDVQLWVEALPSEPGSTAGGLAINSTDRHVGEFHRIAMADLERRLRNQEETVQDLIKLTRSLLQPS
jgi:hypothetical protein